MATASAAVDAAYQQYLGRTAGAAGKDYWVKTWETDYQKAIDSGKTPAQAQAEATSATKKHISSSEEGKQYAAKPKATAAIQSIGDDLLDRAFKTEGLEYWTNEYEQAESKAIEAGKTAEEAAEIADTAVRRNVARSEEAQDVAGVPDWFEHQDHDVGLGIRKEDWADSLQTSNLENYLDHQNYQYGMLQGNTVGQEGNEWWGYQTTQDIQEHLAEGKDWDEAYEAATQGVDRDIRANTGHQNYEKFGSIGYGNPLEIKTSTDPSGDILTEEVYLNLSPKAIADGMGIGGGSKTATQYELDDDGNIKLDDDGNQVVATDDDGNPITDTPYQWNYVPDDSAPGGYRIEPIAFDQTGLTTGHDFHMANYQKDGPYVAGGGGANPFTIPSNVQNVDVERFTSDGADKLDLAQWAETPAGKSSVAAGNFDVKNKWMKDTTGDGNLNFVPSGIDHSTTDSNLGIAAGDTVNIDWGEGWQTNLSGGPKTSNYVPSEQQQTMGGAGGGGNTIINLDTNQKSTTAADKLVKRDERTAYSGAGRKGFSTMKYKPTGNVSTLGIVS